MARRGLPGVREEVVFVLLRQGVRQCGSYEWEQIAPSIEESLTGPECTAIENFLAWLVKDGPGKFGHNIPEVWHQWRTATANRGK